MTNAILAQAPSNAPDLAAIKRRQQVTWSSGDFAVVASRIQFVAEQLAETATLRPGWRVLDIATGSGNAAIAAARSGCSVTGVDYVPSLLETGRARVAAEGLDVTLREGDAEALPVETASFDAVLSVFGVMFAPDQPTAAAELVRSVKSGGTIGLASWTPQGFIGQMFRTIAKHVPPPAGLASPMRWGDPEALRELLGPNVEVTQSVVRNCMFRFRTAGEFVTFFRRWYGPTLKAFESLDADGKLGLEHDLTHLAARWNSSTDHSTVTIPAAYLETIAIKK
ncbi:MAG: class I SAM-dependent methyltransferase [Dehalococcoidia bacterium]